MLRTEWRVLFHLGRYEEMTAKEICQQAMLHKTKVSRAVHALEKKGFLQRKTNAQDRRVEFLSLSPQGQKVFSELSVAAGAFESDLAKQLSVDEMENLRATLSKLIATTPHHDGSDKPALMHARARQVKVSVSSSQSTS